MRAASLFALLLVVPSPVSAQTLFRFPAADPEDTRFMIPPMIGVDHDGQENGDRITCVNFAGQPFPYCYDGHHGTDFLLRAGFVTMDQNVEVVAAADGVVIEAVDGNYDRCHSTSSFQVSCDGNPIIANKVVVRHADGLRSAYYHLKKGSVRVHTGDAVRCGQTLGLAGSSGNSATPHLHFQVEDQKGVVIDPFAGLKSGPHSLWTLQQGPLGRPGDHCQGEPDPKVPLDASASAGRADGGAAIADARADVGPPETHELGGVVGCQLPTSREPTGIVFLIPWLFVWLRTRAR